MSESSIQTPSSHLDRRSFNIAAVVLGVGVLFGFTLLPKLARPHNAMIGKPAPEFTLPSISPESQGDRLALSSLRGKTVILAFWASWCGPCRAEAPGLDHLSKRLADRNVVVLGVNTDDKMENAQAFARSAGLSYPLLHDPNGEVGAAYGVSSLPTLFIIDKEGKIAAVRSGLTDEGSLEELALGAQQGNK